MTTGTKPTHNVSMKLKTLDDNGTEGVLFKKVGAGYMKDNGNVSIKVFLDDKQYTLYINWAQNESKQEKEATKEQA